VTNLVDLFDELFELLDILWLGVLILLAIEA
jgi:hypothetical protein